MTSNRFFKCDWKHASSTDPIEIYCEVDPNGFEVRKVERFPNGSLGWADTISSSSNADTFLAYVEIPPLDEINLSPEFDAFEISETQFRSIFDAAKKTEQRMRGRASAEPRTRNKAAKNKTTPT